MRALIIDDQPLIVCGLQAVMGRFHAPVAVSCAESPEVARQMLTSDLHFDLVLLDLELEGSGGFDFLCELRNTYPAISIVVLSSHLVISGGVYVPPMRLRSQSALEFPETTRDSGWGARLERVPDVSPSAVRRFASARGLTPRQTDVLELLLLGQSNKLIARALHLSVDTVKDHVTSLLRLLKVTSRTQVVLALGQLSDQARRAPDAVSFSSVAEHFIDNGRSLAAVGTPTTS